MISTNDMTEEQIRQAGYDALERHLGVIGTVRFLRQFIGGEGDYSVDRRGWVDGWDLDSLMEEIRLRRTSHVPEPEPTPAAG